LVALVVCERFVHEENLRGSGLESRPRAYQMPHFQISSMYHLMKRSKGRQ
jgi:hypothetical protein